MTLTIKTPKSKNEIINILKENTHEDIPLLKAVYDDNVFKKYFRGVISEDSFKLQRCTRGQISLFPLVYGNIKESRDGTEINIKIKRYKAVNIFFGFWFSGLFVLSLLITIVATRYCFIPFAMMLFGFLLNIIPYKIESKKAIEKLKSIFSAYKNDR